MQDSPPGELSKGVNTSVNGRKGPSIFPVLRILWVRVSEKEKIEYNAKWGTSKRPSHRLEGPIDKEEGILK